MPYSSHGKKFCDLCGHGGEDYLHKADGVCDCCGYPFSFEGSQSITGHRKDLPIVKIRLHENGGVRTLSGRWLDEKSFFVEDNNDPSKQDIDDVFSRIDDLLLNGDFKNVDEILDSVPVEETETDILLTYLTSTLPACTKLEKRESFRRRVESEVFKRGESEPFLFESLSGTHYLLNESMENEKKIRLENSMMKVEIKNLTDSKLDPSTSVEGASNFNVKVMGVVMIFTFVCVFMSVLYLILGNV